MVTVGMYIEDKFSGTRAYIGDKIRYEANIRGGWGSADGINTSTITGFYGGMEVVLDGGYHLPIAGIKSFKVVKRASN